MMKTASIFLALAFLTACTTVVETPRTRQLDQMVEKSPESAQVLADRGFSHAMLGNKSAARKDFRRAINAAESESEEARILWSYGWASFNLELYANALQAWERSIALRESRPWWADHTLAIGYWVNGDLGKALKSYDQAAKKMPDRFETWANLVRYTSFWTWKEKQVIFQIYDAWSRAYREN